MRNFSQAIATSRQSGFTLIEVLIAVAIFTIGILAVNAMQTAAIKGNSSANRITESSSWASDRIETLIGLNYSDADLDDDDGDGTGEDANNDGTDDDGGNFGLDDTGANADGTSASPDGNYTINWNVAVNYPFPDIKTVNVIIERQDGGTIRTVTMAYMKSNSI
ncbi:MAG: prepilin-type N-terminal cleavage/methylation domain-containing protein [Desulfurivibrio sp.]|jgi:prepilin-type N-terminal cleavage/methylation domain-containing protein|nr:MAG: prepilin-type N-terminal cleavage/methylation domain-containing protein [Desulfurivibrio sp.]